MKPELTKNGITFFPVPEFSDVEVAMGADASKFFHRHDRPDVPPEYEDIVQDLFFKGGTIPALSDKVDKLKAKRALQAWLGSFDPAHEAKTSTAAYALWVWTSDDVLPSDNA